MSESKFAVGTQIVASNSYGSKLGKVTKVTKTGQFETDVTHGTKFNPNGSERGGSAWGSTYCRVATKEDINAIEKQEAIRSAIDTIQKATDHPDKIRKIGLEKLNRIVAILKE